MDDSANHQTESDPTDVSAELPEDTIPGFQAPSRSRYRPSEAWALRWLGPQAA